MDFADPEIFGPADGLPDKCANQITVTVTDETYVAWESTAPVGAAIIKGGNASNTYVYDPQDTNDSGLASPPAGPGPAELSNIGGFCWNPEDEPGECFEDETAWAAGTRYVSRGNWATYTSYLGVEKTVTLFAGQTIDVGTVTFSDPDGDNLVTITINLTGEWQFALGEENIKVQAYLSAPSANPAPGLFPYKTTADGQTGEIVVPQNNFYGVHVDVAKQVDCPSDE